MCEKDEKKEDSTERENISGAHKGTIFTWRFVRPLRITVRKKRRAGQRSDQFNTYIMHTFPLLRSRDVLFVLPSGRNALSARPCPVASGFQRINGHFEVNHWQSYTHLAQSKSSFYTARNANYTTSNKVYIETILSRRAIKLSKIRYGC